MKTYVGMIVMAAALVVFAGGVRAGGVTAGPGGRLYLTSMPNNFYDAANIRIGRVL